MTPLEQAARALCASLGIPADERNGGDPFVMDPNRAGGGPRNVVVMLEHVRAVLSAIREPSEAVRNALREHVPVDGHEWEYVTPVMLADGTVVDDEGDCWRAMIDALIASDPALPPAAASEPSHWPGGFQTKVVW